MSVETYFYNYYKIPWRYSPETPEIPSRKKAYMKNTDSIKMENPNPESESYKALDKLEETYYAASVYNRATYHTAEEAAHAIAQKYSAFKYTPAGRNLNQVQISAMYQNELHMTLFGCLGGANFLDPHLHGVGWETEEERQIYNRSMVNSQISHIFSASGIDASLLKGKSLLFTIDPYTFNLTVKGAEDDGLKAQIEKALNEGRNSVELFYHIMRSTSDIPKAVKTKYQLMTSSDGDNAAAGLYRQDLLNSLGGADLSTIPDMILSIGYQDGELRDIPFAHHSRSRIDLKA